MTKEQLEVLFYELIRVAIGTADSLSYTPSEKEWKVLYDMAKKQSLVGVCFAALQRLGADSDGGFARIGMSEIQYLTWMGITANIQQRNEVVNQQCAELQAKLSADGLYSCMLKGQGVAQSYDESLRGLRQSGDIDVWIKGGYDVVCDYVQRTAPNHELAYHRFHYEAFSDTEVELHQHPSLMNNPIHNGKLQKYLDSFGKEQFVELKELGFSIPPSEFNKVFLLCHLYRHFIAEGVGMRQLMDYYFVLKNSQTKENEHVMKVIESLGMRRFARAVMWVMGYLFGLPNSNMICVIDKKEGEYLLNEVLLGGNFGKHDERYEHEGKYAMQKQNIRHSLHLLTHYPSEVLWMPLWLAWHFVWKKMKIQQIKNRYKNR